MKLKRRKFTTTETCSVTVIKSSGGTARWCPECNAEVWMASVEHAAVLSGVSARTVYRRVEAGKIHFIETPAGALRVCLHSLLGGTRAMAARIGAADCEPVIEGKRIS